MKINEGGLSIIRKYEGLRLKTYVCAGGKLTIGYGSTRNVMAGMVITKEEAEARLLQDVRIAENAVMRLVKVPLNRNQFSALVSFVFNLGAGTLANSTLLKHLNNELYWLVPAEFRRFVYAKKKKLKGLIARREEEAKLFEGGSHASDAKI